MINSKRQICPYVEGDVLDLLKTVNDNVRQKFDKVQLKTLGDLLVVGLMWWNLRH